MYNADLHMFCSGLLSTHDGRLVAYGLPEPRFIQPALKSADSSNACGARIARRNGENARPNERRDWDRRAGRASHPLDDYAAANRPGSPFARPTFLCRGAISRPGSCLFARALTSVSRRQFEPTNGWAGPR